MTTMKYGMAEGFPDMAQQAVLDLLRSGATSDPGLSIKAASNADAKTLAFSYSISGVVRAKAAIATQSLAALGTVAIGATKTAFLSIDAAGTVAVTAVAPNDAGVTAIPETASGSTLFGAVTVKNGTASPFVGGTTALDVASLVVTYVGLFGRVPGEAL